MAVDMFMKLEGIQGESKDAHNPGEIEVLSWNCGMTEPRGSADRNRRSGGPRVEDVSFTHYVDRSSPILMLKLISGAILSNGRLLVRRATPDKPFEFYRIFLKNIALVTISTESKIDTQIETKLIETVSLRFEEFKVEYVEMDTNNNPVGTTEASWKIESAELD